MSAPRQLVSPQDCSILIVHQGDDEIKSAAEILQSAGYHIWSACDLGEALPMLTARPFNAIVIKAASASGETAGVVADILSCDSMVSVVVCVLHAYKEVAIAAMEIGAFGYMHKPLDSKEVLVVVRHAVEHSFLLRSHNVEEKIAQMSVQDGLTGLYNKRSLDIVLDKKIIDAGVKGLPFALVMTDIDYFKKLNDTQGHAGGDKLLKSMAKLLQESVRPHDLVFRYGGEEFIIFLDGAESKLALLMAERIRSVVEMYLAQTISVGVAVFPEHGRSARELVVSADAAMYYSKKNGRNRVTLFSSDLPHE